MKDFNTWQRHQINICWIQNVKTIWPCIVTYFLNIFYWLCCYNCPIFFSPLFPSTLHHPSLQHSPLSSCPWVIHVNSLASPFPILFLTSPCLFCIYQFMLLNPFTFFPILSLPPPADNPPSDVHFCDSVHVLVVCLVCFKFFRFSCWYLWVCCRFDLLFPK